MSLTVGKIVFLIVPGFLYTDGNLLMDEPQKTTPMIFDSQTTRPPHRIFFIENGNRVERVIDDEFMPISSSLMNQGFFPYSFGARETSGLQNGTPLMNQASRDFNANKGGSKFSIEDGPLSDSDEFPSLLLTPQRFFHIKVAIPKAYYTTRLHPGPNGNVDIFEVKSIDPLGLTHTERGINMNMDMKLEPQIKSGLNMYNDPTMLSFTNQPRPQATGWSNSASQLSPDPTSRAINDIGPSSPIDDPTSPYGGTSPYSFGNVGQYNPQSNMPNNFNRVSNNFVLNSPFGTPKRLSAASETEMDNRGQNYNPSQIGPQPYQGTKNIPQPFGLNGQYSTTNSSPATSERGVDNSGQDYPSQRGPQSFQGPQNVPIPLSSNIQYGIPNHSPTTPERGVDIRSQDNPSQRGPESFQGAQNIPQPFGPNGQYSTPNNSPTTSERGVDYGGQDYPSHRGPQSFQGPQNIPQPLSSNIQYSIPNHSPTASERGVDIRSQDNPSQRGPQSFQGAQNIPQPLSSNIQYDIPNRFPTASERGMDIRGQDNPSQNAALLNQEKLQGAQIVPQSIQDGHANPQVVQGEPNIPQSFQGTQMSQQPLQEARNVQQSFQVLQGGQPMFQVVQSNPQSLQELKNIPLSFQGEPNVPPSFQGSQSSLQPLQGVQNVPKSFQGSQISPQSLQWSYNSPQLSQGGHQLVQSVSQTSSSLPGVTFQQFREYPTPLHSLFTSRPFRPLLSSNVNNPEVRNHMQPNVQTLLKAVRSLDDGEGS